MRQECADTFIDGDATPPLGIHEVAKPDMTKLVQVAQREFEAFGQRGFFSLPDVILIECDWA